MRVRTEDVGVQGAKLASVKRKRARVVIMELMDKHPTYDRDRLSREFRRAVLADNELLNNVIDYAFDNEFCALMRKLLKGQNDNDREEAIAKVEAEMRRGLLRLMTPIGKRLSQCTGAECRKMGGWYGEVGKTVGRDRLVGDAITEEKLREMLKERMQPL